VTIEVRREVPGHVANRLQAALWREAIHLVNEGVATVEDVDTAGAHTVDDLAARRDALLATIVAATHGR
jgi:3-hydroxyacyl-CoA dehydrogenase